MTFRQPGPWLFALGMIALGVAGMVRPEWLPGLQPAPPSGAVMIRAMEAVLALAGLGLLFRRASRASGLALAVFWLAWLIIHHAPGLMAGPDQTHLWVSAAQALTFAAVAGALARPGYWTVARAVLGATVVLFGVVHLLLPDVIAGLLPGWFPFPDVWPWVSGVGQIAAGLAILTGFKAPVAAFAVGLMWLIWIPLVHLSRLMAAPGDMFEWTFMLTALALAGTAWSVGERAAVPSGEELQPSAH